MKVGEVVTYTIQSGDPVDRLVPGSVGKQRTAVIVNDRGAMKVSRDAEGALVKEYVGNEDSAPANLQVYSMPVVPGSVLRRMVGDPLDANGALPWVWVPRVSFAAPVEVPEVKAQAATEKTSAVKAKAARTEFKAGTWCR